MHHLVLDRIFRVMEMNNLRLRVSVGGVCRVMGGILGHREGDGGSRNRSYKLTGPVWWTYHSE